MVLGRAYKITIYTFAEDPYNIIITLELVSVVGQQ